MLFKTILIVAIIVAVLWVVFYVFDVKDYFTKQGCFNDATMEKVAAKNADDLVLSRGVPSVQRQDYDKIFNDAYQSCLKKHGITK